MKSQEKPTDCYKNFKEFMSRINTLKLDGWQTEELEGIGVKIVKFDHLHIIPIYEVYVGNDLEFSIRVFGWKLPVQHEIYEIYKKSCKNVTLSSLISLLNGYTICCGILQLEQTDFGSFIKHCIPKKVEATDTCISPLHQTEFNRALSCQILTATDQCNDCTSCQGKVAKAAKRKRGNLTIPAKLNAPISQTSTERVKLTLQEYRAENRALKAQIEEIRQELETSAVPVSQDLSKDLTDIMSGIDQEKIPPFMRLFWEEQQNYLSSSKTGIRYHPMVIKFFLGLAAKSASAYDEIRYDEKKQTGILILPSRRTLRSYKNYIRPKQGFNKEIITELCEKVKDFSEAEKNIVILMDEMKIQENLVWDKHTGELIGFVNLGDIDLNYAALQKVDKVASHVLVFLIRSIVNPLKFSLANFATSGATSFQMYPLFWKAVSICELQCKLKVMAVTCDGASTNRKFFKMHAVLGSAEDVVYKTINWYSSDRFIYFFADPPHLIKTARNCLAKSGSGNTSRLLWNDGSHLLWSHIADLFYEDLECGLHLLPRLTYNHIKLNSYSVMNVKLAAQILSSTVSCTLQKFGPPDAQGTAKFCEMMDKFFDCLNVRNTREHAMKQKPALMPYTSTDDERFGWLNNTFVEYFKDWLSSIERKPGKYSKSDKANMFISYQTYEGLQITVKSVIELTKYLLSHGVQYVLTERFCQDPLENYFGRQRGIGQRKDNPTMRDFGYNDNAIRNQKVFLPIASGNCRPDDAEDD